jgi:hypothetical protein
MKNVTLTFDDGKNATTLILSAGHISACNTFLQCFTGGERKGSDIDILISILTEVLTNYSKLQLTNANNSSIVTKSKDGANKVKLPRKKSPFTEDDKEIVALWREMYQVPDNVRLYYPAIKACLKKLRKDLTQIEILQAVKISAENSLVRKMGNPPPLSSILSEKMMGHLVLQVNMRQAKGETGEQVNIRQFKNYMLFELAHNVPVDSIDEYIERVKRCETKEQMQTVYKEYVNGSD